MPASEGRGIEACATSWTMALQIFDTMEDCELIGAQAKKVVWGLRIQKVYALMISQKIIESMYIYVYMYISSSTSVMSCYVI